MNKPDNSRFARVKGRWGIYAVCNICGEKRRTVMSIIWHLIKDHDEAA